MAQKLMTRFFADFLITQSLKIANKIAPVNKEVFFLLLCLFEALKVSFQNLVSSLVIVSIFKEKHDERLPSDDFGHYSIQHRKWPV
jgi:hypothetical protein